MELRSTEKEVASLSALYQTLYHSSITSVLFESSSDEIPISTTTTTTTTTTTIMSNKKVMLMKDYLSSWDEIILETTNNSTNNDTPNDSKEAPEINDDTTTTTTTTATNEMTNMTLQETITTLKSFQERIQQLLPKINRFEKRKNETDPITQTPRYGEKTMTRVSSLIQLYTTLQYTLDQITTIPTPPNPPSSTSNPPIALLPHLENLFHHEQAHLLHQSHQTHLQKLSHEQRLQTEQEAQAQKQRQNEETQRLQRQQHHEELARQAAAVRLAKEQQLEQERLLRREILRKDQLFMDSIEKGVEGVRLQLSVLRQAFAPSNNNNNDNNNNSRTTSTANEYNIAIASLTTIIKQIISEPDNELLRKIKRDHVRFHNDIGRHPGGCELLIAAGFRLVRIPTDDTEEDAPVFLLKEPNIETDMDGWSDWFDMLKATLKELEDGTANV